MVMAGNLVGSIFCICLTVLCTIIVEAVIINY
jgi:hypothetical protein